MSSSSVDNDSGEEEKDVAAAGGNVMEQEQDQDDSEQGEEQGEERIVQLLQEERDAPPTPQRMGNKPNRYKAVQQAENEYEDGSSDVLPQRPGSPPESVMSNPDDTPSVQVSK